MAGVDQNKLGIKIEGDLNDLQFVEEASDSEDSSCESSQAASSNTLSNIPLDIAASFSKTPVFGTVAVTNSENVHFGDKHIKIYNGPINIKQIVQTSSGINNSSYTKTEVENVMKPVKPGKDEKLVKYKLQTWHKLTCSAAGIIILCGICAVVLLVHNNRYQLSASDTGHFDSDGNSSDELLISPKHLRIVSRTDWLAQPVEEPLDRIKQPVPWVIITHTATESCQSQSGCVLAVRLMQTFHIESKDWYDIGYNFLVGGDGSAYYARGWDYIGAHTKFFNKYSISVAFIGTFNKEVPPKHQLDACKKLIKLGVEEGKLAKDYKLFAHRQLMSTLSPGDALFDIIKQWPHFVSNYTSDMIPSY